MDNASTAGEGHIVQRYDKELQHLVTLVADMGNLVSEQIRNAGKAIKKRDAERARLVVECEERVDELDLAIEQEIHRILALRQPMAKDLRMILTVNRMGSYLERIGDQALSIAGLCVRIAGDENVEQQKKLLSAIPRMAKFVNAMVSMSIQAFEKMDMELALEVAEMQSDLNEQFDDALRSLSTFVMEDPRRIGYAVDVILALRSLDRIGGHAESICRQIIFMVKGVNVRHQSVEMLAAEVRSGT